MEAIATSNQKLLGANGIADTSNKKLLGASNKKLLGAKGIATSNKKLLVAGITTIVAFLLLGARS